MLSCKKNSKLGLYALILSCSLIPTVSFADAAKYNGPPGTGINNVEIITTGDGRIYANGKMQAEVAILYDIDDNVNIREIKLLRNRTSDDIQSLGWIYKDEAGNAAPKNDFLNNISSGYNVNNINSNHYTRYIRSNKIDTIDICVEIVAEITYPTEGTTEVSRNTCDGNVNHGFVTIQAIQPYIADPDEFYMKSEQVINAQESTSQLMYNQIQLEEIKVYAPANLSGLIKEFKTDAYIYNQNINYTNNLFLDSKKSAVSAVWYSMKKDDWQYPDLISDYKAYIFQKDAQEVKLHHLNYWKGQTTFDRKFNVVTWSSFYEDDDDSNLLFRLIGERTNDQFRVDANYLCSVSKDYLPDSFNCRAYPTHQNEFDDKDSWWQTLKYNEVASKSNNRDTRNVKVIDVYGTTHTFNIRMNHEGTHAGDRVVSLSVGR
jgi:hypothetical protein